MKCAIVLSPVPENIHNEREPGHYQHQELKSRCNTVLCQAVSSRRSLDHLVEHSPDEVRYRPLASLASTGEHSQWTRA